MNEVPSVALVVVLNHLPYADLVRCRLVCKLWRHLIDRSVGKRDLILFVETNRRPNWWAHNGEAINLKSSLQANYAVFGTMSFFDLFQGVKRLFLCFNQFILFQKFLNKLAKHFGDTLEHLQIDYEFMNQEIQNSPFRLAFQCLKTFCFSKLMDDAMPPPRRLEFVFDCDQLTHLLYPDLTFTSHSLTARVVSNLRVLFVKWLTYSEPLEFPHLQVLGSGNAPGTQFLVSSLPSLREFFFSASFTENPIDAGNLISEFLFSIERGKRKVDVFWLGLKFTQENIRSNLHALIHLIRNGESWIRVQTETLNYYKENRSILNFSYLRYINDFDVFNTSDSFADQLDENADRDLIDNLRTSLSTVRMGSLTEGVDVAKLSGMFQFVARIFVGRIKPADYDLLPVIFPAVRIVQLNPNVPEGIDLSFVSEFKNLYYFKIDRPLSLALVNRILTKCRYIYQISSKKEEKNFFIRKAYKHVFTSTVFFNLKISDISTSLFFTIKEKRELLGALVSNELVLIE